MRGTPGVYHLVLHLERTTTINVGRLGRFTFPRGHYVYTGSAMGGVEARVARHRRRRKTLRWHIDYLLRKARVVDAVAIATAERVECARNRAMLALPGATVTAARFGASDCRCPAHLAYFGEARPKVPRPPSAESCSHAA